MVTVAVAQPPVVSDVYAAVTPLFVGSAASAFLPVVRAPPGCFFFFFFFVFFFFFFFFFFFYIYIYIYIYITCRGPRPWERS